MHGLIKKLALAALVPALALTSVTTFAAFSNAQQKEIQSVVADYLKSNPQVIIAALQEFQRKQMQEADKTIKSTQKDAAQYVKALFHAPNDPVAGNPNGSITIVEFFDYQCPHCVDMNPTLKSAIKNNSNLRVIFKEFPIRGPISEFASRAALAANMQNKYMEFHDALMDTKQPYTQESVLAAAKSVGLNIEQLQKDMQSQTVSDQLQANVKLAQDLKLLGTPAFFLGKTDATTSSNIDYIPGQMSLEQINAAIKKAS